MCHLESLLGKGHIIYEEGQYGKGQMTQKRLQNCFCCCFSGFNSAIVFFFFIL